MKVVVLELRDPSCAVPPDAGQTQDLSFADSRTEQHGDRRDDAEILLSHELVGRRTRQSERDVDPLEHREGDADPLAQVGEGSIRTRRPPSSDLDVPEREVTRRQGIGDRLRIDPHRIEVEDDPGSKDCARCEGPPVRLEDPELGETTDMFRGRPRPPRDFLFCEPLCAHARRPLAR
jgi:hypothetical protein